MFYESSESLINNLWGEFMNILVVDYENIITDKNMQVYDLLQKLKDMHGLNISVDELYSLYLKAEELYSYLPESEFSKKYFDLLELFKGIKISDFEIKITPKPNYYFITKVLDQYHYLFSKVILLTEKPKEVVNSFLKRHRLKFNFNEVIAGVEMFSKETYDSLCNQFSDSDKLMFISSNEFYLYWPKRMNCETIYYVPKLDPRIDHKVLYEFFEFLKMKQFSKK